MSIIKNEKLKSVLSKEESDFESYKIKRIEEASKNLATLEPIAEILDRSGIDWDACTSAIFIKTDYDKRNKAYFSERVRLVAEALGCPPDIHVGEGNYRATFLDGKVWVSIYNPSDCQLIETEETIVRKVLKPHPACVAALAELEEVV